MRIQSAGIAGIDQIPRDFGSGYAHATRMKIAKIPGTPKTIIKDTHSFPCTDKIAGIDITTNKMECLSEYGKSCPSP
jgi:hypothetical protein